MLCGRSRDDDHPRHGDLLPPDDYGAWHRRHGQLLGYAAAQADRYAARPRRDARFDPALLPDREFPDHDWRAVAWRGAVVRFQFLADGARVGSKAAAVGLSAGWIRHPVGAWPT